MDNLLPCIMDPNVDKTIYGDDNIIGHLLEQYGPPTLSYDSKGSLAYYFQGVLVGNISNRNHAAWWCPGSTVNCSTRQCEHETFRVVGLRMQSICSSCQGEIIDSWIATYDSELLKGVKE